MDLFVQNAWHPDHGQVDLEIEGGVIRAMGRHLVASLDVQVLDARGMAIIPGLVNAHTHAAMTLFRGFGDDMPLMQWLETRIWPAEAKLTEEDVYWGTRLACLEMIRSGAINFQDMYWHYHGVARAVEDSGLRAGVGAIFIDVAGKEQAEQFKQQAETLWEETSRYSDRVRYTLTPHAIYTVSPETLRWVAEFSEKHNVPVHIHLSETQHEVDTCLQQHGCRPTQHLANQGLLTERTFLAHAVHVDDAELDMIAKAGATLVTNPVSNMKLAVGGVFPLARAAQRDIPIALGTDGAASNNALDLFQDMKTFALIQKHADVDPTAAPAKLVWEIASGARAPIFGESGRIEVGQAADFLLIHRENPEMTPEHCFTSNLAYAATGHMVDTVVVDGRILMRGRHIEGEQEVRREAALRARALCEAL
ncbi:amidohydrolase [Magnetofaba australis]|uniref:Putative amidohydrolase n=1 Tax=Magnetofaba australis IT-1 TaxID=1434232 RepID=A0A1Y2K5W9_9PROT|nr:amidohydrolase [Magnetofaba australis]OSM05071.1 putative amidohydrolase [Magnetofaba australis IT-1]